MCTRAEKFIYFVIYCPQPDVQRAIPINVYCMQESKFISLWFILIDFPPPPLLEAAAFLFEFYIPQHSLARINPSVMTVTLLTPGGTADRKAVSWATSELSPRKLLCFPWSIVRRDSEAYKEAPVCRGVLLASAWSSLMAQCSRMHWNWGSAESIRTKQAQCYTPSLIHMISSVLSDKQLQAVLLPCSPLRTIDVLLKSCFLGYKANSSQDGYVCISK